MQRSLRSNKSAFRSENSHFISIKLPSSSLTTLKKQTGAKEPRKILRSNCFIMNKLFALSLSLFEHFKQGNILSHWIFPPRAKFSAKSFSSFNFTTRCVCWPARNQKEFRTKKKVDPSYEQAGGSRKIAFYWPPRAREFFCLAFEINFYILPLDEGGFQQTPLGGGEVIPPVGFCSHPRSVCVDGAGIMIITSGAWKISFYGLRWKFAGRGAKMWKTMEELEKKPLFFFWKGKWWKMLCRF